MGIGRLRFGGGWRWCRTWGLACGSAFARQALFVVGPIGLLGGEQGKHDAQELGCSCNDGLLGFSLCNFGGDEGGDAGVMLHRGSHERKEDGAQVGIAAMTDASGDDANAGFVDPWVESGPGDELPHIGEAFDRADFQDQGDG